MLPINGCPSTVKNVTSEMCLPNRCLAMDVSANLLWLHTSGVQASCRNIISRFLNVAVEISKFVSLIPEFRSTEAGIWLYPLARWLQIREASPPLSIHLRDATSTPSFNRSSKQAILNSLSKLYKWTCFVIFTTYNTVKLKVLVSKSLYSVRCSVRNLHFSAQSVGKWQSTFN
jgi:hypothetical protein